LDSNVDDRGIWESIGGWQKYLGTNRWMNGSFVPFPIVWGYFRLFSDIIKMYFRVNNFHHHFVHNHRPSLITTSVYHNNNCCGQSSITTTNYLCHHNHYWRPSPLSIITVTLSVTTTFITSIVAIIFMVITISVTTSAITIYCNQSLLSTSNYHLNHD